jgi:hypothetical protein
VEFFRSLPHEPATTGLWVAAGVMPAKVERATPMGRSQEARAAVSLAVKGYEAEHGTGKDNADANVTSDKESGAWPETKPQGTPAQQPVGAASR